MLQPKRYSILRRLNLNYTIDGRDHAPDEAKISALEVDLQAAIAERDRHNAFLLIDIDHVQERRRRSLIDVFTQGKLGAPRNAQRPFYPPPS
jgi:hypothetical protein